jgi:hypothetical protein
MVISYLVISVTLFSQSVKFTDVNSSTVTAVPSSPNTHHAIFPDKSLPLHCTDKPTDPLTTYTPLSEQIKSEIQSNRLDEKNMDQLKSASVFWTEVRCNAVGPGKSTSLNHGTFPVPLTETNTLKKAPFVRRQ